jgi:hypothetical protein
MACRYLTCIGRDALEAFTRAALLTGTDLDHLKPWEHMCPLVPIGRCGSVHQGHPMPLGEAVDQDALAFPHVGDALAATLARGKKLCPRRWWRGGKARHDAAPAT